MSNLTQTLRVSLAQHALFASFTLLFLSSMRAAYVFIFYADRVQASGDLLFILTQGLRFDIITIGFGATLPILLSLFVSPFSLIWRGWQRLQAAYYVALLAIIIFIELSTPSFIAQFDTRPNILFVEYLKYPKEVFAMLIKAYLGDLVLAAIVIPLICGALFWALKRSFTPATSNLKWSLALFPVMSFLCLLSIRSTFGHRPVNPSVVAVTSDLMINSLALNSTYSVMWAAYNNNTNGGNAFSYGDIDEARAIMLVKENMDVPAEHFTNTEIPTLHQQIAGTQRDKPLNLVIILEESLGAEFVGSLGGLPLTPNLDRLAQQGLWFDNLYATGTRSVRGIEAVITGFTPTTSRSVVKLERSQSGFFTIAELLKNQGYDTSFIYGGEAHFDNMSSFFMGNGFQNITQQKDFVDPKFTGSWGVSDEDLFNMAHDQFSRAGDKPFFSLVFSSSNHTPFEYPENTIEQYDTEKATVNNAVKYADHALGVFFEKAQKSNYWDNTLFLVIADHNSRVAGTELVPVKRFHIPALFLGADITPQRYTTVASQIDMLPTALSLMGINSEHPAIGHDLTQRPTKKPGRAMMQYHETQAYMEGDNVIIFEPNKEAQQFAYRNEALVERGQYDAALKERALAHAKFGPISYRDGSYRLPKQKTYRKHN
ncbi:LTA synthase family protein [Marinagarivorans cellulosilyticus]|uniref:Sulfatase N-terminal domain-containing protein n=1 Tax=Marinagarivorans cellulosilyticus TaxID=2721545 RepID=A0AAN1WEX9_9GAMM|nr:LTA synthase family protein [Marinagarivorans cellulosilyticus]BCD96354.1 hypothetical protein MARGE09_P0554 [Marinagarivorans cellulosilyticus]